MIFSLVVLSYTSVMRKALIIAGSVLLAVLIVLTSVSYVLVQKSFTRVDGAVPLQGITSEVRIYRDSWGVPNIYAENERDLFFAQGYVQAQDRLFQMDLYRRMGSGTLAEVFGDMALDLDRFSRTVGLRRIASGSCSAMDQETRRVLEDYSRGVNEFLKNNGDNLPVEFALLGYKPAPWQPLDTMTISEVIGWNLGKNWEVELLRGRLVQKLGPGKAAQLLAPYPDGSPLIVPPELMTRPLGTTVAIGLHGGSDCLGSNNWVIDGAKSVTGKPLLANDPHLSVMMPSIWYETGLHGAGFNVAGVSLPGCPLVIIGHNEDISWGITNLPADVQDLFMEKINPANEAQYEYKGKWENMQFLDEPIVVRGRSQPDKLKVRITAHGPIMDTAIKGLEQPLAIQWSGNCQSTLLKSAYLLDRAHSWAEFRQALRYWDSPSQNIVYADKDGNIGYQSTGLIPIRGKGKGMVPAPGWTGEYDWTGYIPYDELPNLLNPSTHFVVTANNKVVSDNYTYFLGYDWSPPFRAQRITDLLKAKKVLAVDDFKHIQGDVFDIPASVFCPYLYGITPRDASEKQALELIKKWDFNDRADLPEPAIFHTFYVKLLGNTLRDKLGDKLFNDYAKAMGGSGDVHTVFLSGIIGDNNNDWFDDTQTAIKETRDDIISKSFAEAIAELTGKFGSDSLKWKWGELHKTVFDHVLGRIPLLGAVFSRGPVPTPGSRYTVDVSAFDYNKPYGVTAIPSYRQIIDWSNPGRSLAMHTTGQSGLVFSSHYDDMLNSWVNVQYHTMLFDRKDVEADKQALLVLTP